MSEPTLLAIETSSATGSVALASGERVAERTIATPREQTGRVLGLIAALLDEAGLALADLDALVFGRGPGSFTGLRVAAACAQGLSFAADVPIVSVSSLAALAQRGLTECRPAERGLTERGPEQRGPAAGEAGAGMAPRALCLVDARMGEVYSGCYTLTGGLTGGLAVAATAERIGPPAAVAAPDGPFIALGDGLAGHAAALSGVAAAALAIEPALVPRARDLLPQARADVAAGRFVALEAAQPVYLREADAWRRAEPA